MVEFIHHHFKPGLVSLNRVDVGCVKGVNDYLTDGLQSLSLLLMIDHVSSLDASVVGLDHTTCSKQVAAFLGLSPRRGYDLVGNTNTNPLGFLAVNVVLKEIGIDEHTSFGIEVDATMKESNQHFTHASFLANLT